MTEKWKSAYKSRFYVISRKQLNGPSSPECSQHPRVEIQGRAEELHIKEQEELMGGENSKGGADENILVE